MGIAVQEDMTRSVALAFCLALLDAAAAPTIAGCRSFPPTTSGMRRWTRSPAHPASDAYVATIGATRGVHPDFGTVYEGAPIGIPFVTVPGRNRAYR